MTADDGLRNLMKKGLVAHGFEVLPIETGGVTSGVPDAFWMHRGRRLSGFVECKSTKGWTLKFRPHQLGFAERAPACGVRCSVAVRARGAGSAAGKGDALWLLAGSGADAVATGGLEACPPEALLGRWYGPCRSWPWREVAEALLRE